MGKPRTAKIDRAKRRVLHEMFGHMIQVYLVHAELNLKRSTYVWKAGLTPGELKHIEETVKQLQDIRRRVDVIHQRLKL